MSFRVNAESIHEYAGQLPAGVADTRAIRGYLTEHAALDVSEQGLLSVLWPAHERIVDELHRRLDHLVDLLESARIGLVGAADLYQQTDAQAAARADNAYEYVPRGDA